MHKYGALQSHDGV